MRLPNASHVGARPSCHARAYICTRCIGIGRFDDAQNHPDAMIDSVFADQRWWHVSASMFWLGTTPHPPGALLVFWYPFNGYFWHVDTTAALSMLTRVPFRKKSRIGKLLTVCARTHDQPSLQYTREGKWCCH